MLSVSIIGIGRIGGALALALSRKGWRIADLVHRNADTAERVGAAIAPTPRLHSSADRSDINSDVILITTGDPDIEPAASDLANALSGRPYVFHTSGLLSSASLSALKDIGCRVGSIHPLISISNAFRGSSSFDGAYFCLEGDDDAISVAERIAADLGGRTFSIPSQFKTLYHASAVTACGHLVALIDTAVSMLSKCGLEQSETKKVLMPLIKSTIDNLDVESTANALTGSFARGDIAAIQAHLQALQEYGDVNEQDIYALLGERSLLLAERRGVDADALLNIREAISIAKRNVE